MYNTKRRTQNEERILQAEYTEYTEYTKYTEFTEYTEYTECTECTAYTAYTDQQNTSLYNQVIISQVLISFL